MCFFLCVSVSHGTMLPRSMRTGGYNLPGAESSAVPLIGYRSLQPDGETRSSRPGSFCDESETSHVSDVFFSFFLPSFFAPLEAVCHSATAAPCFPLWQCFTLTRCISPVFPQQSHMTESLLTQPKGDQEKFSSWGSQQCSIKLFGHFFS